MSKLIQAGKTTEIGSDWKPNDLSKQGVINSFHFQHLDEENEDDLSPGEETNKNTDENLHQPITFTVEQFNNEKIVQHEKENAEPGEEEELNKSIQGVEISAQKEGILLNNQFLSNQSKDRFGDRRLTGEHFINTTSPVYSIKALELEEISTSGFDDELSYPGSQRGKSSSLTKEKEKNRRIENLEKMEQELLLAQHQVEEAKKEAERVLESAQQNSALMVDTAREQVEQIRQQAYAEGTKKANADAVFRLKNVEVIVNETINWREQILTQSENTIIDMIRSIGKKLFGNGFRLEVNLVQEMVARAITESTRLGNLRIYMNPQDEEMIVSLWQESEVLLNGQKIQLVPSQTILAGGCFIEGEFGSLDSRIESQVDLIDKEMGQILLDKRRKLGEQE